MKNRKFCQNDKTQMIVRPNNPETHDSPFTAWCPKCGGWYHVNDTNVEVDEVEDFDIREKV